MRLPIDSELLPDSDKAPDRADPPEDEISGTIDLLLKRREKAFEIAEANIKSAQTKQKETCDWKHQPPTFSVGSKVLLENTAQKQRKGGKLESRWLHFYAVLSLYYSQSQVRHLNYNILWGGGAKKREGALEF